MKVVINKCYGGFSLSDAVYLKLIEYGIPCRAYIEQKRGENNLWLPEPLNDGEVIFDRELTPPETDEMSALWHKNKNSGSRLFSNRYWETWIKDRRDDPRLIKAIEEIGTELASGDYARLKIIEIPDGTKYTVEEYDGQEWIAEEHKTWA